MNSNDNSNSGELLQMIEKICKAQEEIFKEDSRYILESQCRIDQYNQIKGDLVKMVIREKQHFYMVRTLLSHQSVPVKSSNSPRKLSSNNGANLEKIPNFDNNDIFEYTGEIKDIKIKLPCFSDLTQFAFDRDDRVIDYFTFSIFPSYFDFFLTKDSLNKLAYFFISVSQLEQTNWFNLLARAVFLSPNFLKFSKLALQPIFSLIIEKKFEINYNDSNEVNNLLSPLSRHMNIFPKEAHITLCCSLDKKKTLQDSFFEIAFSSVEMLLLCNIIHISQIKLVVEKSIGKMKEILKELILNIFEHIFKSKVFIEIFKEVEKIKNKKDSKNFDVKNILNQIKKPENPKFQQPENDINYFPNFDAEFFSSDENYEKEEQNEDDKKFNSLLSKPKYFNETDCNNLPEIFQPLIGSSNDIKFFNFYSEKLDLDFQMNDEKTIYRIYNEYEDIKETNLNANEPTFTEQNLISYLRHLLQLTDKLPNFTKVPPKINNLQNFFEVYLVKRGDPISYKKRKHYSDLFFKYSKSNVSKNFFESIEKIGFQRQSSIRALSAFKKIKPKLLGINELLIQSIEDIQIIIYFSLINKEINSSDKSKIIKYNPKNLTDFSNDLKNLLKQINNQSISTQVFENLCLSIFFFRKNLDLNSFSKLKEDTEINNYLSREENFIEYFSSLVKIKSTNQWDKWLYLSRIILAFELNYYNLSHMKKLNDDEGFNNDEPFKKHISCIKNMNTNNNTNSNKHNDQDNQNNQNINYPFISYKVINEISELVIEGFMEVSLLRKLEILQFAFVLIKKSLLLDLPPGHVLGDDELLPTFTMILMRINPPKFVSNCEFFYNIFSQSTTKYSAFGLLRSIYSSLMSCFEEFAKHFPEKKIKF